MARGRRVFAIFSFLQGVLLSASIAESSENGDACRMELIDKWLNKTSGTHSSDVIPSKESTLNEAFGTGPRLDMALFNNILEDCAFFVKEYNSEAAAICNTSYSELWAIGPINMDAEWLLSADLMLSNNLQDHRPLTPCSDCCHKIYCQTELPATGEDFLEINSIRSFSYQKQTIEHNDEWLNIENAYQNLRLCAAESNVGRTIIAANDRKISSSSIEQASEIAKAYFQQRKNRATCAALALDQGICAIHPPSDPIPIRSGPSSTATKSPMTGIVVVVLVVIALIAQQ